MNHPGDHNWHNRRLRQGADVENYNSTSLVGTQASNHCFLWTISAGKGNPKNTADQKIQMIFNAELGISLP